MTLKNGSIVKVTKGDHLFKGPTSSREQGVSFG